MRVGHRSQFLSVPFNVGGYEYEPLIFILELLKAKIKQNLPYTQIPQMMN
jgi:hypothetical protein